MSFFHKKSVYILGVLIIAAIVVVILVLNNQNYSEAVNDYADDHTNDYVYEYSNDYANEYDDDYVIELNVEDIEHNVLHVSNRSANWYAIDINRNNLVAADVISVFGRIDGVATVADSHMVLGGAESPWNWATSQELLYENQEFHLYLVLEENHIQEPQFVRFRIQTSETAATLPFFIYAIEITRGDTVLYSLANDYIQGLELNQATNLHNSTWLQQAGTPTVTVTHPGATVIAPGFILD